MTSRTSRAQGVTRARRAPVYASSLLLLLTGCTVIPEHRSERPTAGIPSQWQARASASTLTVQPWLPDFSDPVLTALIDEAIQENFDLKAAAARVDAARANAKISGADHLPEISGTLAATRVKRNTSGGLAIADEISNNFSLDFEVTWEADLWGRLRNQTRAAVLDLEAARADLAAARLSLAANIAKSWFNAVEANLQVALAERTVVNFKDNLQVIEEGFRRGINSALDVRLARANVASAQNQLEAQKVVRDGVVRTLEVLLGRYPASGIVLANELPVIKSAVPAGLPSELLARRPDLIAAERRLAASDERTTQARKNRLPGVVLTGSGGTSTSEFKKLIDADSIVWSLLASLTQPIYQGGRLEAEVARSEANSLEALVIYAQAILQAFREVESALAAENLLASQESALQVAASESIEAELLAREQYRAGLTGIITLLESQRRAFNAQSSLIQIINQRLQNRIDLYLALGGPVVDARIAASNGRAASHGQPSDVKQGLSR